MDYEISNMAYDPVRLKDYLIKRLDQLLLDLQVHITMHNKEQVRGNCNEIELLLVNFFGMRMDQIDLIEEKAVRFATYSKLKNGGYSLTSDKNGKRFWLKDGKRVDPKFWLVDNGIGDMRAVRATREFQTWIKESGITKIDWMLDADIIHPVFIEVEGCDTEDFTHAEDNMEHCCSKP